MCNFLKKCIIFFKLIAVYFLVFELVMFGSLRAFLLEFNLIVFILLIPMLFFMQRNFKNIQIPILHLRKYMTFFVLCVSYSLVTGGGLKITGSLPVAYKIAVPITYLYLFFARYYYLFAFVRNTLKPLVLNDEELKKR